MNWILNTNIASDPMFINKNSGDFHLGNESPCIGKGTNEIELGGIEFKSPQVDIENYPRPQPISSMPDIGAYENQLAHPLLAVDNNSMIIGYL